MMAKKEMKIEGEREKHINEKKPKFLSPVVLLLVAVIVLIVLYLLFISPAQVQDTKVDEAAKKYIELYLGLINVTVTDKTLDRGVWIANISAVSSTGPINLEVYLYSQNLTVFKVTQPVNLPAKPATIMELSGKVSCSFEGKTTVDVYIDPYDPWSRQYMAQIESLEQKFGDSIRMQYRIFPTVSYGLSNGGDKEAYTASWYLECLKDTVNFKPMLHCIFDKYAVNGTTLNNTELEGCLSRLGVNTEEIRNCTTVNGTRQLSIDQSFGTTFDEEAVTPLIVIDCRYKTWPLFADRVMCYLYPDFPACK